MGVVPKGFQAESAGNFVGTTPVRVGEACSDQGELEVRNLRRGVGQIKFSTGTKLGKKVF